MRRYARLLLMGVLILSMLMLTSIRLVFSQEVTPDPIPVTATPLPPPTQPPPTETPIPPSVTPSPMPTIIPTDTETLLPTSTETPTTTLLPTLTETPSPTQTETFIPTSTPLPIETVTPEFIPSATPVYSESALVSPDVLQAFNTAPSEFTMQSASNIGQLITELTNANSGQCSSTITVIQLTAQGDYPIDTAQYTTGSYGATGLPLIRCHVRIVGNNSVIRRNAAAEFRIFEVANGGRLILEGVTVSNGLAPVIGGGGILSVSGIVELKNTVIAGNSVKSELSNQVLGGGLYNYTGTTIIQNSTFSMNTNNNSNGDGGGIGIIQGGFYGIGLNLANNTTGRDGGGAAMLFNGIATLTSSCITGNNRSMPSTTSSGIFANWGTNARNNWWGANTGPSGNGSGSGDAALGNISFEAFSPFEISCGTQPPPVGDYHISCTLGQNANVRNYPAGQTQPSIQIDGRIVLSLPPGTVITVYELRPATDGINWARITEFEELNGQDTLWIRTKQPDNATDIIVPGIPACGSLTPDFAQPTQIPPTLSYPIDQPGCVGSNSCPHTSPTISDVDLISFILACEAGAGVQSPIPASIEDAISNAHVVYNRMDSGLYAGSARQVVSQSGQWDPFSQGCHPSLGLNNLAGIHPRIRSTAQQLNQGMEPLENAVHPSIDWMGLYTFGIPNGNHPSAPSSLPNLLTPYCANSASTALLVYLAIASFDNGDRVNASVFFSDIPDCTL